LFSQVCAEYQKSERDKKIPILDPKQIRIELFKHCYMSDQEYNLYGKGDASEFLQSFLELVHFGLNTNKTESVEDTCIM